MKMSVLEVIDNLSDTCKPYFYTLLVVWLAAGLILIMILVMCRPSQTGLATEFPKSEPDNGDTCKYDICIDFGKNKVGINVSSEKHKNKKGKVLDYKVLSIYNGVNWWIGEDALFNDFGAKMHPREFASLILKNEQMQSLLRDAAQVISFGLSSSVPKTWSAQDHEKLATERTKTLAQLLFDSIPKSEGKSGTPIIKCSLGFMQKSSAVAGKPEEREERAVIIGFLKEEYDLDEISDLIQERLPVIMKHSNIDFRNYSKITKGMECSTFIAN